MSPLFFQHQGKCVVAELIGSPTNARRLSKDVCGKTTCAIEPPIG